MNLITQHVHVPSCCNLAMNGNNVSTRMLYHDIAALTITRPGRFTPGERTPSTKFMGGWVSSKADLETVMNIKLSTSQKREEWMESTNPEVIQQ